MFPLGRRKVEDGKLKEFVGDGRYLPVCPYCNEAVTVLRTCDEYYVGDATANRLQCPRWRDQKKRK